MDNYMLHVQELVILTIYLCAQTMGQQRMLYIRKFYVVKNIYIFLLQSFKDFRLLKQVIFNNDISFKLFVFFFKVFELL